MASSEHARAGRPQRAALVLGALASALVVAGAAIALWGLALPPPRDPYATLLNSLPRRTDRATALIHQGLVLAGVGLALAAAAGVVVLGRVLIAARAARVAAARERPSGPPAP